MIELPYLAENTPFPPVSEALNDPNGLLAFGGSLSVRRLFEAYSKGIFPWFSDQEPLLWWSPDPRAIIEPTQFKASKSLRKLARQQRHTVTMNYAFAEVIQQCASIARKSPGSNRISHDTWITQEMLLAYQRLHDAGMAHSVEVWDDHNKLVGGLYGVAVGAVFCGESMFHIAPNTSKLAMYALVKHMLRNELAFIDCQLPTEHLSSLGASTLRRTEFISRLSQHNTMLDNNGSISPRYQQHWQKQVITL